MDIKTERDSHQHPGMGKEQQVSAQHTRDRTTRPDHWDGRPGVGKRLGKHCRHAANQIKDNKAAMSHDVFNVVAKDPQVQHVAAQMHESAVQEHRRKWRQHRIHPLKLRDQPRVIKNDRRDHAECINSGFLARAERQLPEKGHDAKADQRNRHDRRDASGIIVV